MLGIIFENGVQRSPGFPVLIPPGFPAECFHVQPDVDQVELPEKKQRLGVIRVSSAVAHARQPVLVRAAQKGRQQIGARRGTA